MSSINLKVDEPIVILSLADYEALMESLEILTEDSKVLEEITKARKEILAGQGVSLKDFLKALKS